MKKKTLEGELCKNLLKAMQIMRLSLFLIIVSTTIAFSSSSYSQSTKLSIKSENKTVREIISEIETQSEFIFFYQKEQLDLERKVAIQIKDQDIKSILEKLFAGTENTYIVNDRQIVIGKRTVERVSEKSSLNKEEREASPPQKNEIKGKVVDTKGSSLPGVTITIVGTTKGVITDNDGSYSIDVKPGDKLVFSFIGMESQIIDVGNQTSIDVIMKAKSEELEDVTVVAFGKQKKESVIGSITTIKPDELKVPSSNLTTALAGQMAGVIAYQRSGEPGADNADFFVRGITTFGTNTNPLILIDGIELTSTDLARLQPDDIESFSIMKDATATALYGARGANGVILVTTKQGKEGPAKISIRAENSFSMPTTNVELADPVTFMRLSNEAVLTRLRTGELPYSEEKIDYTADGRNPLLYPANDWRSMLFKNYTMNQRLNMNVSGGGGVATYYVAGALNRDNGILKVDDRNNFNNNIDLKKYNLRANVNINVTKTTEMDVRLSGDFDDYSGPINSGTAMYNMVMHSNPVMFPAYYPVDEEHKYVNHILFGNYDNSYINPYAEMVRGYREQHRSQILAQLVGKQDLDFITKGLSARLMLNITRLSDYNVSRSYSPYWYQVGNYDRSTGDYSLAQMNDNGTEYLGYSEGAKAVNSTFYLEGRINYLRTFNEKHGVSGLVVFTRQESTDANAGSIQLSLPSRNMGVSGRATYSYADRYFTEFNFGYNGSERFSSNHRFGFFPSAGLGWMVSNEPFWETINPVVSKLKLRFSYGLVGNDQIGGKTDRFFYLSEVDMNSVARRATFGENMDESLNGVYVSRYANKDISWEKSAKQNYAMELGLWNKVNIIAEYFKERRTNILMTREAIPSTMGLSASVRANVGEASGQGIDISMDYQQAWSNDFWTSARGNFTYATSKYEVFEEPEYAELWRSRVGNSLSQSFGYIAERLFMDDDEAANSPSQDFGSEYGGGDIKYLDVNRDGKISEIDRVPIGYPTVPEIVYGFGSSMGYKNLDFSFFFQGSAHVSFWIDPVSTSPFQGQTQLLKAYADSYWSEDNQDMYAIWPRLSPVVNYNNIQTSTWFMRNGAFLRLKQVELGYTFKGSWKERAHISNMRIYLSGTNLLLFSKFKLWDVEMAGNGLGYPIQRVFNVGLNLSFN